jgi:mRNA interferase RelE/StbE
MKIFQSRSFARKAKKFKKQQKSDLDSAVRAIVKNPGVGVEKKGDLKGVFVHKFNIQGTLFLLSYKFINDDLELLMLGPHENYYRDLKTYLKKK